MGKKYVASFKRAMQISPDDFEMVLETKICTQETTIGEIDAWAKSKCPNAESWFKMFCQINTAD